MTGLDDKKPLLTSFKDSLTSSAEQNFCGVLCVFFVLRETISGTKNHMSHLLSLDLKLSSISPKPQQITTDLSKSHQQTTHFQKPSSPSRADPAEDARNVGALLRKKARLSLTAATLVSLLQKVKGIQRTTSKSSNHIKPF